MATRTSKKWTDAAARLMELLNKKYRSRREIYNIIVDKEQIVGKTQLKKIINRKIRSHELYDERIPRVGHPVWYYLPDKEHRKEWDLYKWRKFQLGESEANSREESTRDWFEMLPEDSRLPEMMDALEKGQKTLPPETVLDRLKKKKRNNF